VSLCIFLFSIDDDGNYGYEHQPGQKEHESTPYCPPAVSLKSARGLLAASGNEDIAARKMNGGTILTTKGIGTHTVSSTAVVE
jgi:hypothetical protein